MGVRLQGYRASGPWVLGGLACWVQGKHAEVQHSSFKGFKYEGSQVSGLGRLIREGSTNVGIYNLRVSGARASLSAGSKSLHSERGKLQATHSPDSMSDFEVLGSRL